MVDEILDGNFQADRGLLDFSVPKVELSVYADTEVEGTFVIYGPVGKVTEGRVLSTDMRMECVTREFGGSEDQILYRFRSAGMQPGEELTGAFHIISSQGEYMLPYNVTVISEVLTSSLGSIKNLFHFTNLAKSNWDEAVKMFYSPEFYRIFEGNDRQYLAAYKGLCAVPGNEHNVEEFLLLINKKKAVEYIPEETQIKIEDPLEGSRYALVLHRNGWGYTHLLVETEGDFLHTETQQITGDDFLGNIYRLYYYIDMEKLHAGNNYGMIRICQNEIRMEIPVTVVRRVGSRRTMGMHREMRQLTVSLMEYYQAYRLKKISPVTWRTETDKLLGRMLEIDDRDLQAKLFQAQLLLTEERYNEAKWMIEKQEAKAFESQTTDPALWCYYLYLTTLYSKDESYIDDVTGMIEGIYTRNRGNWRIAWLLMYLSEEYLKSPTRKWGLLEELFRHHCTSPVIYLEAWHMLCQNPAMLRSLGEFELQILTYAQKQDLLQPEIVLQLVYLAQKTKTYSETLFRLLTGCYEKMPQDDVLHAICALLIKGDRRGGRYFHWYQMGVDINLRITRLYEYYMLSMPEDYAGELPKIILMYFSYQSDLPYDRTAFLYAYVHRNREQFPEIYVSYAPAIEHFVMEQMRSGRINQDLAYLYRHVVSLPMIDEENANHLVRLLFMQEVTVPSTDIKEVIAVYPFGKGQAVYPVVGGKAQVPVYASECRLLLGDGQGNRYAVSIPWEQKQLMKPAKLALMIGTFVRENLGYEIYLCYEYQNTLSVHEENVDLFVYLAQNEWLEERERRHIRRLLLRFFYEKDRMRELDEYLLSLKPSMIERAHRKEVVQYLVLRGLYPEALAWVREYGPDGVDAKTLARLCSNLLQQEEIGEDPVMTGLLYHVMQRGKYDEYILKYLVSYYEGGIKELRDIWTAAESYGLDTYGLSERMLLQMLYTGAYISERAEILASYEKGGGEERLISAVLAQSCYDYAVKGKLTEETVFAGVARMKKRQESVPLACEIAYLQYYAENKAERTEETDQICRDFLEKLLEAGIVLPLYQDYAGFLPQMEEYLDKTILEYRVSPGSKAVIHYVIHGDGNGEQQYCKEEMRNMYAGICVKEFTLFFGERLQYYITEGEDGKEQLTKSSTINKSDMGQESAEGRYSVLNDIMVGKTLQDYNTVDSLLHEYYRQDFMTGKVFKPR